MLNQFTMVYAIPDEEKGFVVEPDTYNYEFSYRTFFHDGDKYYNYGPHMVFVLGEQDVLVDFSKVTGMNRENQPEAFY